MPGLVTNWTMHAKVTTRLSMFQAGRPHGEAGHGRGLAISVGQGCPHRRPYGHGGFDIPPCALYKITTEHTVLLVMQ